MRFHWFYWFCANKKRRTEARLLMNPYLAGVSLVNSIWYNADF